LLRVSDVNEKRPIAILRCSKRVAGATADEALGNAQVSVGELSAPAVPSGVQDVGMGYAARTVVEDMSRGPLPGGRSSSEWPAG
jgi:hypothetical protein